MASGDVFSCKLHMTFAGQQCRPGFYLIEGAGSGDADPVHGVTTMLRGIFGTGCLAGFSAATSIQAFEVADIQPATGRTEVLPVLGPTVGSIADDNPVAPQDSMLIEFTTALKGGKGLFARRSRMYVPGIYGTGQISGFLIPALQDALSAFASILFDTFVTDASQYQLHSVSFNPGTNPRTIREVNPITQFTVDNVVAIQRRRRPGRGI